MTNRPRPLLYGTVTTPPCIVCGESSEFTVAVDKWNRWAGGELIQDVWPERSIDWREQMISGTHPLCWDTLGVDDE